MFRHNQLLGAVLTAFGIGLLFGLWLEGGLLCHCVGIGIAVCGCNVLRKK